MGIDAFVPTSTLSLGLEPPSNHIIDGSWAMASTGPTAYMASLDLYQRPLDVETYDGWTPLTRAALIGDPMLTRLLLLRGANPDAETRLKHTPLT